MSRSARDWDRNFSDRPARSTFSLGVIAIFIILGLSVVGGVGFWALNIASQPGRIVSKTLDADNVINNYEWFKTQHNDIMAMEPKIANAQSAFDTFLASAGPRSTWNTATSTQYSQMQSQLTGLQNQKLSMISAYNARASMMNRSLFMAGSPPSL